MKRRNPAARALADPLFRKRVVKAKKGRGSYVRKPRSAKPPSGASRSCACIPFGRVELVAPALL